MDYAWWIDHIFGTPAAAKNTPAAAALASSLPPEEAVRLMTRIFMNCGSDLARFDDLQVAEGLTFIGAAGESDWMGLVYDRRVPWVDRLACIRSTLTLTATASPRGVRVSRLIRSREPIC